MGGPQDSRGDLDDPGPYGSSFDDFLDEQGIREEIHGKATKAVLAWQIRQELEKSATSKSEFARRLGTSRSQVDRLLDPDNDAVTLETLNRAAEVLGKAVSIRLVEAHSDGSLS